MRLHSDTLTERDLYAALPDGVHANITQKGSRKRARAFEVTLYVLDKDDLHRRYGNSGGYGASTDVAATWDEWGIWMARLYVLDQEALIGWYHDPAHFVAQTLRARNYVQMAHKPGSVEYRTKTAPWLEPRSDMLHDLLGQVRSTQVEV